MKTPANSDVQLTQDQQWSVWAAQAQAGDKAAYNRLLRALSTYARNYVIGTLANPDWAEDVTQEVLISVHKSLKTYSPDKPFKPWFMAILHFRRTDFLRKHYSARGDKTTTLDDAAFLRAHVTNPTHAGEYKDIEAALDSLPAKQRTVFEMMKLQGYSAKEVAKKTGMSVSAVKVSAHRTMAKLKDKLG